MSNIAIHLEGLSKQYRIGGKQESYKTLRDTLTDAFVSPLRKAGKLLRGQGTGASELDETFWALKDVSFEIKQGEVVGIIGRNGAGKSTLLKILSRITEPTEGYAEIHGRVGSLLEVGTGFHPELTGRENIYLNGAILGMRRAEIEKKFDEIVAFAEVEKFINTPVKHYSSGMYLRLAFAVAAHLELETLLVDEVLAVGDASFQKKCMGKMEQVSKQGRTVLFVSHNMGAVANLCEQAIWFDRGKLKLIENSAHVIASYLRSDIESSKWIRSSDKTTDKEAYIQSVRILSHDNQPVDMVNYDKKFKVEIAYKLLEPIRNLNVTYRLSDLQGNIIWATRDTDSGRWNGRERKRGLYLSICTVPGALLRPGEYILSVGCWVEGIKAIDWNENVLVINVSAIGCHFNLDRRGIITPYLEWTVRRIDGI